MIDDLLEKLLLLLLLLFVALIICVPGYLIYHAIVHRNHPGHYETRHQEGYWTNQTVSIDPLITIPIWNEPYDYQAWVCDHEATP